METLILKKLAYYTIQTHQSLKELKTSEVLCPYEEEILKKILKQKKQILFDFAMSQQQQFQEITN